jgi:hypothetical protein
VNKELKDWEKELKLPPPLPPAPHIKKPWHKFLPYLAMLAKFIGGKFNDRKTPRDIHGEDDQGTGA